MSEPNPSAYFPPPRQRSNHRILHPIELRIPLEGGGHIDVCYRLTKNNHPSPEHAPCSYGVNPDTKSIESYFSTQDSAALEITLHNHSRHDLKHVRLSDIRVVPVGEHPSDAHGHGPPKLPDGNLLFEVVPNEAYYGRVSADEKEVKYLSLITRGVSPGRYVVRLEIKYDIEQCKVPVDLWLEVNPD